MSYFNSDKIIQEAIAVISSIELSLIKQSGYKLGDADMNVDPEKQAKVDRLTSLVHFTSHLEAENAKQFSTISDLSNKVRMLTYMIDKLQNQIDVDKNIKEL